MSRTILHLITQRSFPTHYAVIFFIGQLYNPVLETPGNFTLTAFVSATAHAN